MNFGCEETSRYLDAWVDGELDPGASMLVESHVAACEDCRAESEMIGTLKRGLASLREQDAATPSLRSRIAAALEAEDTQHSAAAMAARRKKHASGFLVAGAALVSLVAVAGRHARTTPPDVDVQGAGIIPPVLEDIATRHARDLPVEVSGSQPEQVERFFRGRLDIPVRPVSFRGVPAQLVGARISNVRDRMAAALFYDMSGRRVTVFVFDGSLLPREGGGVLYRTMVNNQPVYVGNAHGYSVAFSEHDGVGYAVASDLPAQEAVRIIAQAEIQ